MNRPFHGLALCACLTALSGCDPRAEQDAMAGTLVLGSFATAPLAAGDTLREVSLTSMPPAVQSVWRAAAREVQGPETCTRAFVKDSMYVLRALRVCGRPPSADIWLPDWANIAVMSSGRIVDSGIQVARAMATICPSGRDPNGHPYFGQKYRLEGCARFWPEVAIESLSAGIGTPRGVILPNAVRRGLLDQCSRETPDRADFEWMPTPADIGRLEEDLGRFVSSHAPARVAASLSQYGRQYGGYGVGSDTLIYVSLVWHVQVDSSLWMRMPILTCDGGEGFWGIVYDPRTRTFSQIAFNGTA